MYFCQIKLDGDRGSFFANKKLGSHVNTAFEQLSKFLLMTPEVDHCTSQWLKHKPGNRALSSVKATLK